MNETVEFLPKKNKYCIAVFVLNERERLIQQLKLMQRLSDVDIIVADGGSNDGSTDAMVLKSFGVNTLLIKKDEGKLGTQMRMAFSWALDRQYDGIIVVDGNGKDDIEAVPRFIAKLREGYDHIQGSRFIEGGEHKNTPLCRLVAIRMIHAPLIRLASGFHYTDTTNGFRAYSSNLLKNPKIAVFRKIFIGYELHYYLAVKAAKLEFRCTEIPVRRIYPIGQIPTKISFFRGNFEVIIKLLKVVLGEYNVN